MDMQEKLNGMEQRIAIKDAEPKIPPITIHLHNDGEQTTRIHKIQRGPDGEMMGAEIVRGRRNRIKGDDDGARDQSIDAER
jgi:hypothetical protein